jgi:hypothetical protein
VAPRYGACADGAFDPAGKATDRREGNGMTRYLISFDVHAMDDIPEEDFPAVSDAAHAVVQQALDAGVLVTAGGREDGWAAVVAVDGTVTDGALPDAVGGVTIVDVPTREAALEWAAKVAVACRCPQEVWEIMPDPQLDAMLRAAGRTF